MFPMKQCNLGLIDKLFWEVSNPASTLYGKYLSFQEISNLTQNLKAADATIDYLLALGIPEEDIQTLGLFVTASVPIRRTEFHVYSHPQFEDRIGRARLLIFLRL